MKLYIRYMDDLIMIHESREFLEECMRAVEEELRKIGFETNPKKTRIYNLRDGIMFLGFRFCLTETGKVVMIADPKKVKAARKKYRRLVAKAKRGECTKESVDMSWATWINHLENGNSYKLIQRMNQYYNDLWEEQANEDQVQGQHTTGTGYIGKCAGTGGDQQGEH